MRIHAAILAAALGLTLASPALANPEPLTCAEVAEKIAKAVGVTVGRRSASGDPTFIGQSESGLATARDSLVLSCSEPFDVFVSHENSTPPDWWFRDAAAAGSVVSGFPRSQIERLARRCLNAALLEAPKSEAAELAAGAPPERASFANGSAEIEAGKLRVECVARAKDPFANITILRKDSLQ